MGLVYTLLLFLQVTLCNNWKQTASFILDKNSKPRQILASGDLRSAFVLLYLVPTRYFLQMNSRMTQELQKKAMRTGGSRSNAKML
ncbi:uncharacterized protein BKA55DRAFT_550565 [Fusarium redolens]|jgi:hypothetical protein|uniref:Secreted protein n=1 Tax=Fusarium redolens TaxID=48865 RepID=A0A9P9KWY7_FUSRE|nr:uncharacterized protein BKA55DRAFT_550565 [Fusarium redolens]KAH7270089.1 hypothetical protein BKA55DRAFT_550565 [Fusarium redolens]